MNERIGIGLASWGLAALLVAGVGLAQPSAQPSALPRFAAQPGKLTVNLTIKLLRDGYPISDAIYCGAELTAQQRRDYALPLQRWGGNRSSRYNWKINCDAAGHDWYFLNGGEPVNDPAQSGWIKAARESQRLNASLYLTVPMLGWVAKDATSYSFSVKKYGPQQGHEPGKPDVGNGRRPDGKPITGNDPTDTSVPAPPEFIAQGVKATVAAVGSAAKGGVRYWVLDNEPMLWHLTHRDVFPQPLGYDEFWQRTVRYAQAIRQADPTAQIAGYCSWGWMDLFYSAKDQGDDNYQRKPDYHAHGQVPLAEWFLQQCAQYRLKHGRAPIDIFDIHWYPQAQAQGQNVYTGRGMALALNELRLRSTRDLWDRTYRQESWISDVTAEPVALIPRVRGWIAKHCPGLQLALGEYNFGGSDNITGALAQAELFGIFAQEKLDLAFIWTRPEGTQELAWKLFRNYDGRGGRFGDRFLGSAISDQHVSVFVAKRSTDAAHTVVLINKNLGRAVDLSVAVPGLKGRARTWAFDQDDPQQLRLGQPVTIEQTIRLTMPPATAMIMVID
jgi:hypothetical protein